jgi:hypothetical protein
LAGGLGVLILGIAALVMLIRNSSENPYEKQVEAAERRKPPAPQRLVDEIPPPKPAPPPATKEVPPPREVPAPVAVAAPPPSPSPPRNPVPPELLRRLKDEILALPPFYQGLLLDPALRARCEALAGGAAGTEADAVQIAALLGGPRLKAVRDDRAKIEEGLTASEEEAGKGLPVDRITMENGTFLHCRILEESADVVTVERRMPGGSFLKSGLQRA